MITKGILQYQNGHFLPYFKDKSKVTFSIYAQALAFSCEETILRKKRILLPIPTESAKLFRDKWNCYLFDAGS